MENEYKKGRKMHLHKYNRIINELQITKYENNFQNQRWNKLSPIKASDYKTWLTNIYLNEKNSSVIFERRFRRIEIICQIYNDILQKTFRVPSQLTEEKMVDLMELDAIEDITKQINFLYDVEMKRWTEKQFRNEDKINIKEKLDLRNSGRSSRIGIFDENNGELVYGLWHNCLFTRIKPQAKKDFIAKSHLKNSCLFGQKVVIDFGFEEFLYKISSKQLMSYLVKMLSFNKYKLEEPFDIYFNNLNSSGFMSQLINRFFYTNNLKEYYIDIKNDSYLNHFDSTKICYICPQADEPLQEYDHNAVYVLPGVVHNRMDPPLSMLRVKHECIEMKRIPIEEFGVLRYNYHLEVHHTLKILSHFRDYNDMNKALELYLPKSVWKTEEEVEDEDESIAKRKFYQKMIGFQHKAKVYRKDNN